MVYVRTLFKSRSLWPSFVFVQKRLFNQKTISLQFKDLLVEGKKGEFKDLKVIFSGGLVSRGINVEELIGLELERLIVLVV